MCCDVEKTRIQSLFRDFIHSRLLFLTSVTPFLLKLWVCHSLFLQVCLTFIKVYISTALAFFISKLIFFHLTTNMFEKICRTAFCARPNRTTGDSHFPIFYGNILTSIGIIEAHMHVHIQVLSDEHFFPVNKINTAFDTKYLFSAAD